MGDHDEFSEEDVSARFVPPRVAVPGKTGTVQIVFKNGATVVLEKVSFTTLAIHDPKAGRPFTFYCWDANGNKKIVGLPSRKISSETSQTKQAFGAETIEAAFYLSED